MTKLEKLCRAMCESLQINPDELMNDPAQAAERALVPGAIDLCINRYPRWRAMIPAVTAMLQEMKALPEKLVTEAIFESVKLSGYGSREVIMSSWRSLMDYFITGGDGGEEVVKPQPMGLKIQDWLAGISGRKQGVLLMALRGPDGFAKEHPCKDLIRTLRACVMKSGRSGSAMHLGEVYESDKFMRMDLISDDSLWRETKKKFFDSFDEYNTHFKLHVIHAAEVLGFEHPLWIVKSRWNEVYLEFCNRAHVNPETKEQFDERLKDGMRAEDLAFEDYKKLEAAREENSDVSHPN
jgi:hypothetical protein